MEATNVLHKKKSLAPALRFKEFDSDWDNKYLKEVLTLITRPIRMEDEQVYSLVTVRRRYEGVVHRGDYKGKDVKVKSQFLLRTNDFLISKRQISHNACGLVPKELSGSIVSNEYSVFLPQKNLDIQYFNYFCRLPKVSKTFFLSSTGVHIEKLIFKVDVWLKWRFAFPSLPEQQKIASFLSAVDEKIQQLNRKKELLERYKKGVMQQLFSGKLGFKDENGKAFPMWEEKKIGEITSVSAGGTPNTFKKEYWGGDIRWMNSGELNLKIVKEVENRITAAGLKNSSTKIIPVKCILIGLAGQGKTRGTAAINLVELCTNQSIAAIYPNYEKFVPEYLFQNIDQRYDELRGMSTGDGGRGGLNLQIIKSFKIPLPTVNEQKKMANYLSCIDIKIESVTNQITQTQAFKKGLLQQMFV